MIPNAMYPAQVWDGSSPDRVTVPGNPVRQIIAAPDPVDWAQITSEVIAVETTLVSLNTAYKASAHGNAQVGTPSLAGTATAGFLCVPIVSADPTGTPTPGEYTGFVPLCYNPTTLKLWAWTGSAWHYTLFT